MAVIALSIEPYAVVPGFPRRLCRKLGLALADFASFERDMAQRLCLTNGDIMTALGTTPAVREWPMTSAEFVARAGELALEAALGGNVVVNGWMASAALRPLAHIPCFRLSASAQVRAANLQRHLRYAYAASAELELESEDCFVDSLSTLLPNGNLRGVGRREQLINMELLTEAACIEAIARCARSPRWAATAAAEDAIHGRLRELR